MRLKLGRMAEANPRISDTLPRRGRVNEVCREWVVYEDEALAYQLQKQEVEQHYGGNKERNARVREDFPKAKEEQEKEILEAAEKYRQTVKKQEQIDLTYARNFAERMEREEYERRRRAQSQDMEMARKIQSSELIRNATINPSEHHCYRHELKSPVKVSPISIPDVNRVGLPLVQSGNFEQNDRHQSSMAITHSLKSLRLSAEDSLSECVSPSQSSLPSSSLLPPQPPEIELSTFSSQHPSTFRDHMSPTRIPTQATSISKDLKTILRDVDSQEEVDKKLQEAKDAELARMLQSQEEDIFSEEIDRDRKIAIEAQDKELAKLLYEKEKAKVRRAKERAKQRALLKKRQQQQEEQSRSSNLDSILVDENTSHGSAGTDESCVENVTLSSNSSKQRSCESKDSNATDEEQELRDFHYNSPSHSSTLTSERRLAPSLMNVAMHIDPTYLSQQSSSTPNSLIFQDGDTTAPPYMPIQGQRRNTPIVDKKPKKSKSKDNCKQQ